MALGVRYANVDLAVASGLQRWVDLLMHVSAYDVNCQYRIHFNTRMQKLCEDIKAMEMGHLIKMNENKLFPWTVAGVGKFHLAGHRADCRYRWSFNFLPYSTMVDGEAPERVWAVSNTLGNRTREMNPGHRHDQMNEFYSDQNTRRVHDIGEHSSYIREPPITNFFELANYLARKNRLAEVHSRLCQEGLASLEAEITERFGSAWLDRCKTQEREFKRRVLIMSEHANLENPYDLVKPNGEATKYSIFVVNYTD